ncbi:MAG: carbamate kinase [Oculatellaceae cyanobacterium Prado106]|jgi:carbamate kinase|nr:carbamate kinase [Oculatellaceae cyanobacterium Prado106]
MRIVVALGGNALLRRGEPMTAENQRSSIRTAAQALQELAQKHQLILSHGNGPQVGLLALQSAAYTAVESYPLDVLDAESEGMIGYLIEQELGNVLPPDQPFATLLTMIEVDPKDPAFQNPSKPIGPLYRKEEAEKLAQERGWAMKAEIQGASMDQQFRRIVPSPLPQRIIELRPIRWLLEKGVIVICAGGGGIPTVLDADGKLRGVEAVIDKDRASALLARELEADCLLLATDVDAVYLNWGTPKAQALRRTSPKQLAELEFAAGSMAPKVSAAIEFVEKTGKIAAIGALADLSGMLIGEAGTFIQPEIEMTSDITFSHS